jgi:hypothetical protein
MNRQDLVTELRRVGQEMIDLGAKMDYFAGFDSEIADKGRELLGAGMIAQQWAEEVEKCDQ